MANNKRFYWLKLKENFFEEDTISWLEEQENGKEYCLFYLKLCLKSLKTDGILIRNVGELLVPYDIKKLAEMTHTDIDTARVSMEIFEKIGLIQILENGEIYLTQLENMVGSETTKAETMRRLRSQKKIEGNIVTKMLPRERVRERDKEIEKDIEIELEDKIRHKFGTYGRIHLTDKQYQKLIEDFSKEVVDTKINQLDEYVEMNNNKNKYKNFNLVLRKAIRENWFDNNNTKQQKTNREIKEQKIKEIEEKFLKGE